MSIELVIRREGSKEILQQVYVEKDSTVRVGRIEKDNDVVLKEASVSRHHAIFSFARNADTDTESLRCLVKDCRSFNGTFVGGIKVEKETDVPPLGEVRMGGIVLTWNESSSVADSAGVAGTAVPPPLTLPPSSPSSPVRKRKRSDEGDKKTKNSRVSKSLVKWKNGDCKEDENDDDDEATLHVFSPHPCEDMASEVELARIEHSLFGIGGTPCRRDLTQGNLNNCYLVAGLGLVAEYFPDAIRAAICERGQKLFEVTFQIPRRSASRGHSVATNGIFKVQCDDRFFCTKRRGGLRRRRVKAAVALREDKDRLRPIYMQSPTHALWPLLLEKAWIKFLGGISYDDICDDAKGKKSGGSKRLRGFPLHAGFVVQSLTGIMYDMYQLEQRTDHEIFSDMSRVFESRTPCFVGTFKSTSKTRAMYKKLQQTERIKIFSNHNYAVLGWRQMEEDGVRYFRIRNPHNRTRVKRSKTMTLACPARIHRMTTQAKINPLEHGQEFECTIEQLRRYFMTYEISRRGGTSLCDQRRSIVTFAGKSWDSHGKVA
eukprot:g240.t1